MKTQMNTRYGPGRVEIKIKMTKNTVTIVIARAGDEISCIIEPSDALRLRDAIDRAFRTGDEIDAR